MKRMSVPLRRLFARAAIPAFALAGYQVQAQPTAPAPSGAATTASAQEEEETIVMDPFLVEASEDEGSYKATSTLAGTRVRTNLEDVASSISVVTNQFLQDTGAKNSQELLVYTTNTEVAGIGGNFSGQAGNPTYNESLINPSNVTRVRGLDAADNTRDYFLTDIPWDSFNVGRIDLQRGPNSILFGVGSPAGIINGSLNNAEFRDSYKFENLIYGDGGMRNFIDLNREVIPEQLAVRIAVLRDEREYQQEPAFNDSTRYYGAVRFDPKLFGEGNRTSFRAKYEHGYVRSNNPRAIPPVDEITPWFTRINKATLNQYSLTPNPNYNPNVAESASNPAYIGHDANSTYSGALFNTPSSNGSWKQGRSYWSDVLTYFNGASANGTISPIVSSNPTKIITAAINTGFRLNSNGVADGAALQNGLAVPAFFPAGIPPYGLYAANTSSIVGGAYYADKVLTDPSIFDFYNNLLDGENKREWQDWDAANVSLSQTFFDNRLGFEAVLDHQEYESGQKNFLNAVNHAISIDVNATYADGTANPNVGRPYVANANAGGTSSSRIIRNGVRLTGTYELRADDIFGNNETLSKILGTHMFTGLWSKDSRKNTAVNWTQYSATPEWALWGNLPVAPLGNNRQFDWVYYLGDKNLTSASTASGANIPRITSLIAPQANTVVRAFDSHWNNPAVSPGAPYTFVNYSTGVTTTTTQSQNPANYVGWTNVAVNWLNADNPTDFPSLVTSGKKDWYRNESQGLTWQGYFWDGNLVPTFGWRKDRVVNYSTPAPLNGTTGVAALDYNHDLTSRTTASGQSRSWGGVFHLPRGLTEGVGGTRLSVFYNKSENFKADAPRTNLFGQTIGNPAGETKEYGFLVSTLEDKLSLKVAWYDTKVANATFNATQGNSIAGLGGNGYWMWAAPTWGLAYASFVEATLDGVPGANNGNYAAQDGITNNGAGDPAFENAPQTALSRQIVNAWLHIPLPANFFTYYGIRPLTYDLAGKSKIRDAISGWTPTMNVGGQQPGGINAVSTIDTWSEGKEIELVAQPTRNWNITVNYAKTEATKRNIDSATTAFMADLYDFFAGPGGQLRMWGQGGPTIQSQWLPNVYLPYLVSVLAEGQSAPEVAPWRLNAISTYSFSEGAVRGAFIGGGIRMEAGKIIGYPIDQATVGNPAVPVALDPTNPYKGDTDTHYDLWLGYTRRFGEKVNWRIQLNLRDVGENNRLVASRLNPDGSLALARIQEGMSWQLTNSFEF